MCLADKRVQKGTIWATLLLKALVRPQSTLRCVPLHDRSEHDSLWHPKRNLGSISDMRTAVKESPVGEGRSYDGLISIRGVMASCSVAGGGWWTFIHHRVGWNCQGAVPCSYQWWPVVISDYRLDVWWPIKTCWKIVIIAFTTPIQASGPTPALLCSVKHQVRCPCTELLLNISAQSNSRSIAWKN